MPKRLKRHTLTFNNIGEIMEVASAHRHLLPNNGRMREHFHGVESWEEVETLVTRGWEGEEAEAMSIVDSLVTTIQREHEMPNFTPVWDVAGSMVDIGRFTAGEPENMIDFLPLPVPRSGRVISLCASVSVSSAVEPDAIKRRGHAIAALALALTRLGLNVELWADESGRDGDIIGSTRTLIKGANDSLDLSRIMFAYCHPAFMRALCLATIHAMPAPYNTQIPNGMYGLPQNPEENLPEGAIYIGCVLTPENIPDPSVFVKRHLRSLGLIED